MDRESAQRGFKPVSWFGFIRAGVVCIACSFSFSSFYRVTVLRFYLGGWMLSAIHQSSALQGLSRWDQAILEGNDGCFLSLCPFASI